MSLCREVLESQSYIEMYGPTIDVCCVPAMSLNRMLLTINHLKSHRAGSF